MEIQNKATYTAGQPRLAAAIATSALVPISCYVSDKLGHPKLSAGEAGKLNEIVKDVFNSSGLAKKGASLVPEARDIPAGGGKFFANLFKESKPKEIFHGADKSVHYLKDRPLVAFHEMGHAVDFFKNKVPKKIMTAHGVLKLVQPLFIFGAMGIAVAAAAKKSSGGSRSELKGESDNKPKGGFLEKIQNNYGKTVGATFLTLSVVPEVTASINGAKLAKQAGLSKDLLKKMRTGNILGIATYAFGAVALGAMMNFVAKAEELPGALFKKKSAKETA
ncbi:hypothetical protein tpqmel_0291 [Candidatus Gastranaerophilus sp. (ex Termes propinquus)]|nr:hypothetical protein tpqmel_0291 [Candidatus Gastranaerophilus sp. (ex Termes propinquus)]